MKVPSSSTGRSVGNGSNSGKTYAYWSDLCNQSLYQTPGKEKFSNSVGKRESRESKEESYIGTMI